jgi:putative ABC transport system permease protein
MGWLTRLANRVRRRDRGRKIDPSALRERTREANLLVGLEHFLQDLRHGVRMLARNPVLAGICVVSIAFGTGANVAIFSMADALLLRPLPIPQPSEVVTVGYEVLRGTFYRTSASYRDFQDIRARAASFEGLAAYLYRPIAIAPRAADPARIRLVAFVSDDFFRALSIDLQIGRGFLPEEDGVGGRGSVVVISDALWRGGFGGDPAILGRTMHVAARDVTIVGVTAPSFSGLEPYIRDSVFVPAGLLPRMGDSGSGHRPDILEARDARLFTVKGRLRAGVSLSAAQAELMTIGRDLARAWPDTNTNQALVAQTELAYKYEARPLDSALIVVLTVLSVAVLGVACANVAGLLASRAPIRSREMALRLAIGADRLRLIRQLMTESLAIAVLGAAGGIGVGSAGIALLRQIPFPTDIVSLPPFELDRRTLAFSVGVAMASALLVGLGPALQTTRVDLTSSLKSSDRTGAGRTRLTGRSVLVSVQVALSMTLVTLTVFAIQVFGRELSKGPGWRVTHVAQLHVDAGQGGYTEEGATRFFTSLIDKTRALPGVRSASATSALPMYDFDFTSLLREGERLPRGEAPPPVWSASIDERYFETMGIGLISGRIFRQTDDADATPVAIVNDTLARHYWAGQDAIGKRLQVLGAEAGLVEIVGVVRTTTLGFPGELPQNGIYFPYRQRRARYMTVLAYTDGESAALVKPLEDLARRLDPDVPIHDGQTMESFFGARVTGFGGVIFRLVAGMGIMGVALTMVGLYGLVSYNVSRRTREIGIRIAVGATYARIMTMVLRQGMSPAFAGVAAGLVGSAVAARFMEGLVPFSYRVNRETFFYVVPVLLVIALGAAFLPARRAARVNPTEALRCD